MLYEVITLVPIKVPQPLRSEDLAAISERILAVEEQKERFERNHEVSYNFV